MTSFNNDPMIGKIRKLLKQAESAVKNGNKAEAEAYNSKASELIAKHGVDQALLAEKGEIQDAIVSMMFDINGEFSMDRRVLLTHIIKAMGGSAVIISSHRPGTYQSKDYTVHAFAYQSDMNRIQFLYEILTSQMLLGSAVAARNVEKKRSFRKSWMLGFSYAIYVRLKKDEEVAVAAAGTGTDVVLYNRSLAVEQAQCVEYPELGKPVERKLGSSGRAQGYMAGKRASLGDNELDNNSRRPAIVG